MEEGRGVVWLNEGREGGDWSAVHAGHEDFIDILVGAAAFESRVVPAQGKVVGTNRLIFAVGESRGGRAVALPVRTVTLPAFELGEERFAVGNAIDGNRGLGGNLDRFAGFFFFPTGREDLDVGHQVGALVRTKRIPNGHV